MWKHAHFTKNVRVIISLFFLIIILCTACSSGSSSAQKAELKKKELQLINKEKDLKKMEEKLLEKEKELDNKLRECQKSNENKNKQEEQKRLDEEKRKQEELKKQQQDSNTTPASQSKPEAKPVQGGTCTIKGNKNSKGEKIYHIPGQQFYDKTNAEEMFCSEADAQAAGYRASKK
ncbi:hypothetical protein CN339_28825 [Bacillus thuringiensis]|nr:hypothetical protein COM73_30160 [Bacillus thuringiensis]PFF69648.1 hypothetical protein CN339_28825 [Bacillus thuringiensis]